MPVFQSGGPVPDWCELRSFEIITLNPGQSHRFDRREAREKLIAGRGACRVKTGADELDLAEREMFDLADGLDTFEAIAGEGPATVIRMSGRWGDELGGTGIFGAREVEDPRDNGDPVDYPKRTSFDAHYHDCDEYWILFEGRGSAVSEGKHYDVGPGDCVATGMGHHHDFPLVSEPVRAVFFETTMEGEKRRGHLWNHTHGIAQPKADRT
jgi:mannose-6-phosphate isomerase-like protein (cupin superfamily)